MNNSNGLKMVSAILTLSIGILTFCQSIISNKQTDLKIEAKVDKAIAKRLGS